jgi:hypothetical protein
VKPQRGSPVARDTGRVGEDAGRVGEDAARVGENAARVGEDAVRARLDVLFGSFDRLTPDELARVGLHRPEDAERQALLRQVGAAARVSGRSALLAEARAAARDAVLRRYAEGGLHPSWVGALNWGLSRGHDR